MVLMIGAVELWRYRQVLLLGAGVVALVQSVMNGTIREQLEVAKGMALKDHDAAWANYITTVCKGATDDPSADIVWFDGQFCSWRKGTLR
jgi:hypothetical protein